jgi:hypothetical protein
LGNLRIPRADRPGGQPASADPDAPLAPDLLVADLDPLDRRTAGPDAAEGLFGTCTGTADVPGGQLAIVLGGQAEGNLTAAIVGGTGAYEGATGSVTVKSSGGEGLLETFTFTLPWALEAAGL